jgi:polyferredoxin
MMTKNLEKEIVELRERNRRVEADKAWETSWTRRCLIALFTYLALGLYLWVIRIPEPWLNAIVPTVGFLLSTLTLPWFMGLWLARR